MENYYRQVEKIRQHHLNKPVSKFTVRFKTQVMIHDYVDCALPMLQRVFKKREKSYKAMGYTLQYAYNNNKNNKQPALQLKNNHY